MILLKKLQSKLHKTLDYSLKIIKISENIPNYFIGKVYHNFSVNHPHMDIY
jgi:hypothetical protein